MNKELQFLIYNTPQENIKVDVVFSILEITTQYGAIISVVSTTLNDRIATSLRDTCHLVVERSRNDRIAKSKRPNCEVETTELRSRNDRLKNKIVYYERIYVYFRVC